MFVMSLVPFISAEPRLKSERHARLPTTPINRPAPC